MSTLSSSSPMLLADGYASGMPSVFVAATTAVSSAIIATGFWTGQGYGSNQRGASPGGLKLGDILMHVASTGSATPGRVTLHSVLTGTANQASTLASSAFGNTGYDVTVSQSS